MNIGKLVHKYPEVREAVEKIHEFLLAVTPDRSHKPHNWKKEGF